MEKTKGQLLGDLYVNPMLDANLKYYIQNGLTKREYMATQILAGISANRWSMELGHLSFEQLAEMSIKQTDALLEALSKP